MASPFTHPPIEPEGAESADPSEHRIPVGDASLYARTVGRDPAPIVCHGGPDFDHGYLIAQGRAAREPRSR